MCVFTELALTSHDFLQKKGGCAGQAGIHLYHSASDVSCEHGQGSGQIQDPHFFGIKGDFSSVASL